MKEFSWIKIGEDKDRNILMCVANKEKDKKSETNKKLIHNLTDRNDLDMERIGIELDYNEDDNYGE